MKNNTLDISWKDITLKQFEEIQEIFSDNDMDEFTKSANLVRIIYNKDLNDIPLADINNYLEPINNLFQTRYNSDKKLKSVYTINGHNYKIIKKIEEITTAAFIDYNEYLKQENNTTKLLSCVLIPEGHAYNDGYNIEEVMNDMNDLPIEDVTAISFFLLRSIRKL